ncbi:MAG: hypothetical protein RMY64_25615 [Nostoc sp. DedQUE08]|uniref:hypothetical protein n=1 Tax=Nostoc sp. DedQUE08 TaxID=3075393 RepID=UPI002AD1DCF4|nr:hypothetical protein [Nostoc sp. DedQUE08]MDZ8068973.1 hypothetical protein [Nostoc sp. DedQUE08]
MKVDGNGQGKILTQDELRRLFTEGFLSPRDHLWRVVTPSHSIKIGEHQAQAAAS